MLARAGRVVEAEYHLPFLAHATMEPMNCVAHVHGDRCDIWAPTQAPTGAAGAVAQALGIPPDRVTVNTTLLGGGFGRRLLHDFAVEAALVSRAAGGPVQVVWTREDDLQAGWYRPASLHRMRGAVAGGGAVAWKHLIVTPSIDGVRVPTIQSDEFNQFAVMGFANLAYTIPNLRIEYARVNTAVPVAWWRSVYSSQLVFANESFVDELATAAGVDPLEFRLTMLPPGSREREVLALAAERAGWGRALPAGGGLGIAMHEYFGTVAAAVAEVAASGGSEFRVVRLTLAVNCGLLVNPRIAAAQIEGGALFGLSAALHESVTIREGAVVQSNFHDYRLLRMSEAPPVDVLRAQHRSADWRRGAGNPSDRPGGGECALRRHRPPGAHPSVGARRRLSHRHSPSLIRSTLRFFAWALYTRRLTMSPGFIPLSRSASSAGDFTGLPSTSRMISGPPRSVSTSSPQEGPPAVTSVTRSPRCAGVSSNRATSSSVTGATVTPSRPTAAPASLRSPVSAPLRAATAVAPGMAWSLTS
jgi:hypothetical protein